ncbi:helix-turn-helix transcriptional regulator [Streptomyces sp. S.PB5]|uniref:helix-turn-helix domain-containing protein n=1 Tax=Streptomyces sp. S.PB5 TaxID=3020844 RepID=UPI0025B2088F|nr:helix-turn-helix transcriptional regulator [Streptomyces sp. S.PB5]MDN3023982.1 helix-turn-helix transcriptional regulator [Streptomyces sp. S.PB5]
MGAQPAEFNEFAACLRALRERAGLSYGALARRTGISSSSLHRYCSGSYVPQDYGAAHHFATACGASPEELRRLHRLWALADAARDGEGDTHADTGTDADADADTHTGTATAPYAVPDARPGQNDAPEPGPPPPTAPPSSRRRRPRLLPGLGVLALTLTLALLLGATLWDTDSEPAAESLPTLLRPGGSRSAAPPQDASRPPGSRADDCPRPGQRLKTPTHQRVYLVGPGGSLYFVPNATIYFNLWDTWDAVTVVDDGVFAECGWAAAYELTDAFLARTAGGTEVYVWDAWSGYRRVPSGAAFNRYGFSASKIQTRSALSPVSDHNWP